MIQSSGTCARCRAGISASEAPGALNPIGDSVAIRTQVGRGHDQTLHEFFQCDECGTVWARLTDSGVGGHGLSYQRLTDKLY